MEFELDETPPIATALAEPVDVPLDEDYEVYMARIDNIGYDATGRMSVPEDIAPYPPEVADSVNEVDTLLGWK